MVYFYVKFYHWSFNEFKILLQLKFVNKSIIFLKSFIYINFVGLITHLVLNFSPVF